MPIETRRSILPDSEDPIADADVIQTANILGYCFDRALRDRAVRFDSEGDALRTEEPTGDAKRWKKWNSARRDEFVDLRLLQEVAYLVMPIVGGPLPEEMHGSILFGPVKADNPSIVAQHAEQMTEQEKAAEREALAYCHRIGDGPWDQGKLGYRGQGSYTGVVKWLNGDGPTFTHFCTTRRVLTNDATHALRWHPDRDDEVGRMAALGRREGQRRWGMQATNGAQRKIHDEQYMHFVGDPGDGDIVCYNHGLPLALVEERASPTRRGITMEVVGASPAEEWGDLTKKTASCFQCAVYIDAAGLSTSSVHLGRGESWVPPYPVDYTEPAHRHAAARLLSNWYTRCDDNLRKGCALLVASGAVTATHQRSLELLDDLLDEVLRAAVEGVPGAVRRSAELILDASTIHDKDYMKVLRTLWPSDEARTLAQMVREHVEAAQDAYPAQD